MATFNPHGYKPYTVVLSADTGDLYERVVWLKSNEAYGAYCLKHELGKGMVYQFTDERTAALFKLRFG